MMAPHFHTRPFQKLPVSNRFNLREDKAAVQWQWSRLCFFLIVGAVLMGLASADALAAQQPQPQPNPAQNPAIVLQQTVRRVRVDVVVTDGQGQPVAGLQAADFHVAEDGKPQSIRQFESHSDQNAEPALPKRPQLPPHTFMNLPEAPEHGPLTVLLYDVLNTPVEDQLSARAQMVDFIKKSGGRSIAIFVLGDRLRLLQGFTSDTEQLERTASASGTKTQRSPLMTAPPLGSEDMAAIAAKAKAAGDNQSAAVLQRMAEREANSESAYASYRLDRRVDITLDALSQVGRFLAGIPGRKNLIWFSATFPAGVLPDQDKSSGAVRSDTQLVDVAERNYSARMRTASDLLSAAEVAVYPVDARSMQTNSYFTASEDTSRRSVYSASSDVSKSGLAFHQQLSQGITTMDTLAEQTGGRAFYNTNGLSQAMVTASADGASYYSLLYAPDNTKYDGSLRHISIHLERGNYHLAYRRSYLADDTEPSGQPHGASDANSAPAQAAFTDLEFGAPPSHQLVFAARVDALEKPVPATAEQMAALVPYQELAAKARNRKFIPPAAPLQMQQYQVQYGLLTKQLVLPESPNGDYHSDLSIAALAFNEDGDALWGTKARLKDDIPASKMKEIRENGYRAMQAFFVPVDTAVIRLVVRDELGGRVGSMEIRLPLESNQQQPSQAR